MPLIHHLIDQRPDLMPQVLASDAARGWILMIEGGRRLREVLRQSQGLRHWRRLLPAYGQLQRDLAVTPQVLLSLGVPDRRLARLPRELERLLAEESALRIGEADGISIDQLARLRELAEGLGELVDQLAAFSIPQSLDHGDFHDANVFLTNSGFAVIDWGDANLTHPFFSLRTAFVSIKHTFDLAADDSAFERLRDDYLESWQELLPLEDLRLAFQQASRLWSLGSALRWHRAIGHLSLEERDPYRHAVPALLEELLAANRITD